MITNSEISMEPTTDHKCPQCGVGLLLFQSTNTKICIDCGQEFVWDIERYKGPIITRTCSTIKK